MTITLHPVSSIQRNLLYTTNSSSSTIKILKYFPHVQCCYKQCFSTEWDSQVSIDVVTEILRNAKIPNKGCWSRASCSTCCMNHFFTRWERPFQEMDSTKDMQTKTTLFCSQVGYWPLIPGFYVEEKCYFEYKSSCCQIKALWKLWAFHSLCPFILQTFLVILECPEAICSSFYESKFI